MRNIFCWLFCVSATLVISADLRADEKVIDRCPQLNTATYRFAANADQPDTHGEEEIIQVVNRFFDGLKIKNQKLKQYRRVITDDFFIYEMGKKYSIEELINLFQTPNRKWISTDWKFSEFRVSLDQNSAHASYVNTGVFYYEEDGKKFRSDLKWLESVYMVKSSNQWKIKFLQSDDVSRETTEVTVSAETEIKDKSN